jgi:hypothetical protein
LISWERSERLLVKASSGLIAVSTLELAVESQPFQRMGENQTGILIPRIFIYSTNHDIIL